MEDYVDYVSFDHKDSIAAQHAGPGIMLLTASMQLLYKNRRAWELCEHMIKRQKGKTTNGGLPPAIACLVGQIRKTFQVRTDPKDWEQFQLRRIVNTLHRPVLLCGMGLIDPSNWETQILIVMNEMGIGTWQDNVIVRRRRCFTGPLAKQPSSTSLDGSGMTDVEGALPAHS